MDDKLVKYTVTLTKEDFERLKIRALRHTQSIDDLIRDNNWLGNELEHFMDRGYTLEIISPDKHVFEFKTRDLAKGNAILMVDKQLLRSIKRLLRLRLFGLSTSELTKKLELEEGEMRAILAKLDSLDVVNLFRNDTVMLKTTQRARQFLEGFVYTFLLMGLVSYGTYYSLLVLHQDIRFIIINIAQIMIFLTLLSSLWNWISKKIPRKKVS